MKKTITLFKKRPILYSIIAIVVILIIYFVFFGASNTAGSTITVQKKDFVQKLSVSGIAEASQTANLGFAQSGRISRVYANVGEPVTKGMIIAKIENGDLEASLIQKQFALKKEQANLKTKQLNILPGQDTLITQKYKDAVLDYIASLHKADLTIEQALFTKVDTVFRNGNSVNPNIDLNINNRTAESSMENKRLLITERLEDWIDIIKQLDSAGADSSRDLINKSQSMTKEVLTLARDLINRLIEITGSLGTSDGYDQTTINTYRTNINDAGQLVSTAVTTLNTAESALNIAYNAFILEQGGSTSNDIDAQVAITSSAEADVMSAQAQLEKTIVRAPFDGVITKMDAKVGEIATSNTSSISINGNGLFVVKSNVPEVYISNLKVGNMATATLDAYGPSVKFSLKVIAIDPAQTVVNGVSNYRTTLQFDPTEKMIRSGMTANVEITTQEVPDTFVVPLGAIFTKDGKEFIQIKDGEIYKDKEVSVGSMTGVGEANVTSGLSEGDVVLLNPIKK